MLNKTVKFIVPVYNLAPSETITNCLADGFTLYPAGSINKLSIAKDPDFAAILRSSEKESLTQNALIYYEGPIGNLPFQINPATIDLRELLAMLYSTLNRYCYRFWQIGDTAAHLGTGYILYEEFFYYVKHINFQPTCADATIFPLTVNASDIEEINRTFLLQYRMVVLDKKAQGVSFEKNETSNEKFTAQPKFLQEAYTHNRIIRADFSLQKGRNEDFLPLKITFYILVTECLFSVDDSSEVTHKVAERVANYVGAHEAEKIEIFKLIKKAYGVRSKFVHGQKLANNNTHDKLITISKDMDSLLRKVMNKITESEESLQVFLDSDNDMNDFFLKLLFKDDIPDAQ